MPVFCGRQIECRLGMHSSQSRDGQAWGSCGGQRIRCRDGARPLCHSPTFLAGGGLLGSGK